MSEPKERFFFYIEELGEGAPQGVPILGADESQGQE